MDFMTRASGLTLGVIVSVMCIGSGMALILTAAAFKIYHPDIIFAYEGLRKISDLLIHSIINAYADWGLIADMQTEWRSILEYLNSIPMYKLTPEQAHNLEELRIKIIYVLEVYPRRDPRIIYGRKYEELVHLSSVFLDSIAEGDRIIYGILVHNLDWWSSISMYNDACKNMLRGLYMDRLPNVS